MDIDLEMTRENIIKLSVAGGLLLVAVVIVIFTLWSKPKIPVIEDASGTEPLMGSDRSGSGVP